MDRPGAPGSGNFLGSVQVRLPAVSAVWSAVGWKRARGKDRDIQKQLRNPFCHQDTRFAAQVHRAIIFMLLSMLLNERKFIETCEHKKIFIKICSAEMQKGIQQTKEIPYLALDVQRSHDLLGLGSFVQKNIL